MLTLERVLARRDVSLSSVVHEGLGYLRSMARPDGSIAEQPGSAFFRNWDSVNALRAAAAWHARDDWVRALLDYLGGRESPDGLMHPGDGVCVRTEYCTETSGEYLVALAGLGHRDRAARGARYLGSRQLPGGGWELTDPRVPRAFHTVASVTAFAILALDAADVAVPARDLAITGLLRAQRPEGHFGANRFFYHSPFYVARPVVEVIGDHPAAVGAAVEYTRAAQRRDGGWAAEFDVVGDSLTDDVVTALALGTLAAAGVDAGDPAVRRGLLWLLDRRRANGSWCGGHYPYYPATGDLPDVRTPQDVYATSQVLITLAALARLEEAHE